MDIGNVGQMSDALLRKFIDFVEEEDGVIQKRKQKITSAEKQKAHVLKVLNAASKGQVEFPEEESYLAQGSARDDILDEKLAQKGYSLIEQMRDHKPVDLARRNMKYLKYAEKTSLNTNKVRSIISMTVKARNPAKIIKQERAKITCLREPKNGNKKKNMNSGSVFSEADFAAIRKKKVKPVSRFDVI